MFTNNNPLSYIDPDGGYDGQALNQGKNDPGADIGYWDQLYEMCPTCDMDDIAAMDKSIRKYGFVIPETIEEISNSKETVLVGEETKYTQQGSFDWNGNEYMSAWQATDYSYYMSYSKSNASLISISTWERNPYIDAVYEEQEAFMNHPVTRNLKIGLALVLSSGISSTYSIVRNSYSLIESSNKVEQQFEDFVEYYSIGNTSKLKFGRGSSQTPYHNFINHQEPMLSGLNVPDLVIKMVGIGTIGSVFKTIDDQNKRVEHKGIHSH